MNMTDFSAFDPKNWYWSVGDGPADSVYSSAVPGFVATDDATYEAWLAAGNTATEIPTAAALGAYLAGAGIRPSDADDDAPVLEGYKERHAREVTLEAVFKVVMCQENRMRAIERALGLNDNPPNCPADEAFDLVKGLM